VSPPSDTSFQRTEADSSPCVRAPQSRVSPLPQFLPEDPTWRSAPARIPLGHETKVLACLKSVLYKQYERIRAKVR
jgi:hypothetical protein